MKSEDPFVAVRVLLTRKEYESIRHDANWTGPGTASAVIRERLGWQQSPYGYGKWSRERLLEGQKMPVATVDKDLHDDVSRDKYSAKP